MIKDCVSKCEKHVPRITQCKDSGKIYDEKNCMIFNDDEEWGMFEKGNRNVGEKMECLIEFLKRRDRVPQSLRSRAQQFNDGIIKSEREVESIEITMTHPPPDG